MAVLFVLLSSAKLPVSSSDGVSTAFRARLLKVFPKYIEWPEGDKKGDFVVGFVGNSSLASAFTTAMQGRTVGSQKVIVKQYSSSNEVGKCHILYVATDKSGELKSCISKINKYNTLVITDKNGLINQSGINFVMAGPALKFELNTKYLGANNLKYNPDLKKIALKVIE